MPRKSPPGPAPGMWTRHSISSSECPAPFSFQTLKCDISFHIHFILSSCAAPFGCHKCQFCHSLLTPFCLPASQQHYLSQLLLQSTLSPHLLLLQSYACPSPAPILPHSLYPGTDRKNVRLIFLTSPWLVSLQPPLSLSFLLFVHLCSPSCPAVLHGLLWWPGEAHYHAQFRHLLSLPAFGQV